jgi:thioredoxin 1
MTKYSLILPLAAVVTLSGCWWNTPKSNSAQTPTTEKSPQDAAEAKAITQMSSEEQFTKLLKESSKLIVVKIDAPWCSACKDIHPYFVDAAIKGTDYIFARVNVDILPNIAQQFDIIGIPALLFIKNGKEITDSRIVGAEINSGDELLAKIKAINTATESATLGEQTTPEEEKTP